MYMCIERYIFMHAHVVHVRLSTLTCMHVHVQYVNVREYCRPSHMHICSCTTMYMYCSCVLRHSGVFRM